MRQKVLSKAFFLCAEKQARMETILWGRHTTSSQQCVLAWSSNNPRMYFLAVMVTKKVQLLNHFSATVALEEFGKVSVCLEQWQIGKAGQRHPARVQWIALQRIISCQQFWPCVSHMNLSNSKERKFLPGQQVRHCPASICKTTADCTHVAGMHLLHGLTGKIPCWFIRARIRPAGMGYNSSPVNA